MASLNPIQKQSYMTVSSMLEKSRDSIAAALPRHLTVDRLTRIALGELRTNQKLLNCQPESLMSSIVKASQLGLEVGSAMGHAYLVPYGVECTLIIGYRGMIALARRSGEIQSITARVVYERDLFELEYGLDEKLRHIPSTDADPGPVSHVYAVAKLKDGGIQYEVMTRAEVEAIRKRSRADSSGPWVTDWSEMARKTVMRRLFKYLPMSIEMADALAAESDDDKPIERNITPSTVVDLNTRLAVEIAKDETAPWPKSNADGELIDARGIAWDERIHSSSKACTEDGTWRKRRGADPELISKIEASSVTASEPTDYARGLELIRAETTTDGLDGILDWMRDADIDEEQRASLNAAIESRRGEMI